MHYPDDDVLKKKSREVKKIDERTLTLLSDMTETMYSAYGAGPAAVQVGILKRVVVIDDGTGLIKLINPVLCETLGEQNELEGCLGIPGIYGKVKRPERVIVRALNENGDPVEPEGTDLPACTFCREIDRLDGILFIEKVLPRTFIRQNEPDPEIVNK